jgi:diguanylate cyclase (GGDEF)-like protein
MDSWEAALRDLRRQFVRGTGDRLSRIETAIARLAAGPDRPSLEALRREFHGLSGSGSTYGFPRATSLGLEGEASCDRLLARDAEPGSAELQRWNGILRELREEFGAAPGPEEAGHSEGGAAAWELLLVEDDPEFRSAMRRLCYREGMNVREAGSLAEGLRELQRRLPDATLVDVGLPDGSGYTLVERLRAMPGGEGVAVVIVSGLASFVDKVEAVHCGADGYFEKPVNWDALHRRLRHLRERSIIPLSRVLSVEDDPDQAAFLRTVLESGGYEVRVVSDPAEFEAVLIAFRPDLILMDVLLPGGVDGYALARFVRQDERYATLPILFLTAQRQAQAQIEALRAGGDDHLVKPVSPGLLLTTVAARIERARFLRSLLDRDGLTGLLTHTAFLERVRGAAGQAHRDSSKCPTLAILDLDRFKAVNDRFGHPVGDRVLATLAALLRRRVRQSDTVGRLGGEEFALLLEDLSREDALRLIDRVREEFSTLEHTAPGPSTFRVTFSGGVAELDPSRMDSRSWLEAADAALYAAKSGGRNRVEAAAQAGAGSA